MNQAIWDLVVGHDEAVAMLKEAVASQRVTHAWLFTGPPGIGKLHTARVFAAAPVEEVADQIRAAVLGLLT
ncbi:MAG TPA: hypothetical protein VFN05_06750 [Actinomycetes bacterium]|nr:hypothetical protein [Actinomycetes bacterium]